MDIGEINWLIRLFAGGDFQDPGRKTQKGYYRYYYRRNSNRWAAGR